MSMRSIGLRRTAVVLAMVVMAVSGPWPLAAAPAGRASVLLTRAQADSLVTVRPSAVRDRALTEWARRANANDLTWVLRRPAAQFGALERPLLEAVLASLPPARGELRQRLMARRTLASGRGAKRTDVSGLELGALRPYASVFRIAVVLPDEGDYASYGRTLRAALADGLAFDRAADALPITLDTLGTGDSDPARVAAALQQAVAASDIVVGELLSTPTQALATGARLAGVVLVSPTATDERIGRIGGQVFQLGPSAEMRAHALAEAVLGHERHTLAIVGTAPGIRSTFASAFAREVEERGGKVARREVLGGDAVRAATVAAAVKAAEVDVLLWEGGTREAETLVRALATVGAALRMCGGPALAPDGFRAAARPLLEGVTWVDDVWRSPEPVRTRLDSLATVTGTRAGSLWLRGWLVGRRLAAAIDAGARTSSEVAAALRARDPALAASGYLDLASDGVLLPVYTVRRGRAVVADANQ